MTQLMYQSSRFTFSII